MSMVTPQNLVYPTRYYIPPIAIESSIGCTVFYGII